MILKFEIFTPHKILANYKMLHFDIIKSYEQFINAANNIRQWNFELFLCQYLKNNICDIRLIAHDHVKKHDLPYNLNDYLETFHATCSTFCTSR